MSPRIAEAGRLALGSRAAGVALLSLTALLFCVPQAALASATGPRTVGDTGPIVSGYRSNKCIDDLGDGTANKTPAVIWNCDGSPGQAWTIEADGTIQVNGKCLDVRRFGKKNKTPVELWRCTGGANQQWVQTIDGALVSADSNKCLDLPKFNVTNGTQLEIYTCNDGRNQKWQLP
jgi:Ricin-type beta-trefoil lectin domain